MPFELSASTESGAALVASAEALARDFASRAAQHDRDGSYPFESVDALRRARYFAAPIPKSLGGLGVSCVHDLIVSSSRLAKGDAAVRSGSTCTSSSSPTSYGGGVWQSLPAISGAAKRSTTRSGTSSARTW
ncbi:MAG: acyl-CoA dehydrogenase family protein [Solirubrobacterales bacterium]|nr:acyl-CoA dehydrogenase family protein [Solirubrobacterales bacterium]